MSIRDGKWTPEEAEGVLAREGIVWSIGQLTPAAVRRLNKAGQRERAMWPYYHVGTIEKTCWLWLRRGVRA